MNSLQRKIRLQRGANMRYVPLMRGKIIPTGSIPWFLTHDYNQCFELTIDFLNFLHVVKFIKFYNVYKFIAWVYFYHGSKTPGMEPVVWSPFLPKKHLNSHNFSKQFNNIIEQFYLLLVQKVSFKCKSIINWLLQFCLQICPSLFFFKSLSLSFLSF